MKISKLTNINNANGISFDNANGTSFFNDVITTSYENLIKILGEPSCYENTGTDKVNIEFIACLGTDTFTIYDWKLYRVIDPTEIITWHIGAHSKVISNKVKNTLKKLL